MSSVMTPANNQQRLELEDQRKLSGIKEVGESEEDDDSFFEPMRYFAAEDDTVELDQLVAMESRIDDLIHLIRAVSTTGGMTQDYALEAKKVLPDFDGNSPIGYYTKLPSATRLKASVEEISKGIWGLIVAGIAAIVAVIYKIVKWVHGDSEADAKAKLADQIKRMAMLPVILTESSETMRKGEDILRGVKPVLTDRHGREFQCISFDAIVDRYFTDDQKYSRAKKFLSANDPMFADIINGGIYSKSIMSVGNILRAAEGLIDDKINVVKRVITRDLGKMSPLDKNRNLHSLEILEPVSFNFQDQNRTLLEIAAAVAKDRETVMQSHTERKLSYDNIFSVMASAYKSRGMDEILKAVQSSFDVLKKMESQLTDVQSVCRTLESDGLPGELTADIGQFLRETISDIFQDVSGYRKLIADVYEYAKALETWHRTVAGFAIEIVKKTTLEFHRAKIAVPLGWNEVLRDLKEQSAKIGK